MLYILYFKEMKEQVEVSNNDSLLTTHRKVRDKVLNYREIHVIDLN